MLKAELHTHINLDPQDKDIDYDVYKLIDEIKKRKYDVLGITCHNYYFEDLKAKEYARKREIVLIFGIEKDIEGMHVLIYNCSKNIEKINTFKELKEYKKKNREVLIIAPHPFFLTSSCLKNHIIKYEYLFDAYEFSYFYTKFFNFNNKTVQLAKEFKKPLIANCDVHELNFINNVYTLIDSKLDETEIIESIRQGKVEIRKTPLPITVFLRIGFKVIVHKIKKIF